MADEITTGMYLVLAYAETIDAGNGYCLSRYGGSGSNKEHMVLFQEKYRSSPNVASVYVDDGVAQIVAPMLGGKVACVRQADLVTPENGDPYPRAYANVYNEANWGGRRGCWRIEKVANLTGYYDGKPYPLYRIVSEMGYSNHKMEMAFVNRANGAAVRFEDYADSTGNLNHFWMFIPQNSAPDGFYKIRVSKSVNTVLIGQSNGAVTLAADSERSDNRDIWVVQHDGVEPDHQFIRNLGGIIVDEESGYLMVPNGQNKEKGRPTVGRLRDDWRYDRWVLLPRDRSDKYNNDYYQSYELLSNAFNYDYWSVSRYILCPFKASSSSLLTYPEFRLSYTDSAAEIKRFQYFLTWAHAYNKNLTVPSKLAFNYKGVPNYTAFGVSGSGQYIYPSWVGGNNSDWQLRYRIVGFRYSTDKVATNRTYSDSSWKSIMDGESSNNGWGDNEIPNCSATLSYNEGNSSGNGAAGRYVSNLGIPVTLGTGSGEMDRIVIEFQVRAWESSFDKVSENLSCHGGSASARFSVCYLPTLTLSHLKVDAYGLYLDYASDLLRNGNKIIINSPGNTESLPWRKRMSSYAAGSVMRNRMENQKVCENGVAKHSGKYYLDFGAAGVPNVGDEFPFSWTIVSPDGVTNSGSTVLAVEQADFSNVVTVDCPVSATAGGTRMLRIDAAQTTGTYVELLQGAKCTLVINHRPNGTAESSQFAKTSANAPYLEYINIPRSGRQPNEYFVVPYPFGKPFMVEVLGGTADSQGRIGRFEYTHAAFNNERDKTRMWNFGSYISDNDWYEVFVNEDTNPEESVSTQFTNTEIKTIRRDWELVQFGNTPEQARSVTGVVYPALMPDYISRTERFSKCKYAWYRSFDGEVLRVAIIGVNETRKVWGESVSIDMRRVDV